MSMSKKMKEMIKECDKCEGHAECELYNKLKTILDAVKDIDKDTAIYKLKINIGFAIEIILLAIWIFFIKNPPISYFLIILGVFIVISIYTISARNKYIKIQIERLEALGNAIGIPEEKLKEMRRNLEGKPTTIAEKMMNCKLRKEHGSNYCVKCPESYTCASLEECSKNENKEVVGVTND